MSEQPPYPPGHPTAPVSPQGMSAVPQRAGLAIAALVFGLLGFCLPPLGLLGLILGIVALVKTTRRPHLYGGKGVAIGGICVGSVSLIFGTAMLALCVSMMLPSLARARELARRTVCANNLKMVGAALHAYAAGNEGAYPPDLNVLVSQNYISRAVLKCPTADAINYVYVPRPADSVGPLDVVMFEPLANHGGDGGAVLFADGHVEFVNAANWEVLIEPLRDRIPAPDE